MAGYIGKVQIGAGDPALVGSTLYGISTTPAGTAAKTATSIDDNTGKFINNNLTTNPIQGTTIHVKFTLGNSVTSNVTLQVGTVNQAVPVDGMPECDNNAIISFTYDENQHWVANDNIDNDTTYTFAEGTTNGAFTITPTGGSTQTLSVHGLNNSAYKDVDTSITSANTSSLNVPTTAAVAAYVQEQTGGLSGLTGAMHFRGQINSNNWPISAIDSYTNYISGDVVLAPNDKEYVYIKGDSAANSHWIELGDESSYALKSSTATVIGIATNGFTPNSLPSIQIDSVSIPNVTTAGSASVSNGILTINPTVLGTAISVGSASNWNQGSQASLTPASTVVVVPDSNPSP